MKFHHIGYLTSNFKTSVKEFGKINYLKKGLTINDKLLQVKIQFIKNSNNLIELVKPYKKNYGLRQITKKKKLCLSFCI